MIRNRLVRTKTQIQQVRAANMATVVVKQPSATLANGCLSGILLGLAILVELHLLAHNPALICGYMSVYVDGYFPWYSLGRWKFAPIKSQCWKCLSISNS